MQGGWRAAAPRSGLRRGRKHIGFLQSNHPAWQAFPASVECRAAGALPGVALAGSSWSQPLAHSYLQALQRKTNDSLGTVSVSLLRRASSPRLSRERPRPRGQRRPWLPSCLHGYVCWSLLQLSGLSPLVFQNRNKYPDSSFIKMEFCCKEINVILTLQDLEVKPP